MHKILKWKQKAKKRQAIFKKLFEGGMTKTAIGKKYSISKERVRVILLTDYDRPIIGIGRPKKINNK